MSQIQDLVLSDSLFALYYAVKQSYKGEKPIIDLSTVDLDKIHHLFSYYKPHLTNYRQMKDVLGEEYISPELQSSLLGSEVPQDASLENLAEFTRFKIILDEQKNQFPYVKIDDSDNPRLLFTGTFKKGVARTKCEEHLKSLCKNFTGLTIYDKYLAVDKSKEQCLKLIKKIVSLMDFSCARTLTVVCWSPNRSTIQRIENSDEWKLLNDCLKNVKKDLPNFRYMLCDCWQSEYKDCHDRYMKIISKTGSVEVLLSSGFENLFDSQKDFTYVVRAI